MSNKQAVIYARAQVGVQAPLVTVEVHIAPGLPVFSIVGLPETVVKEAKDRVRCALLNVGIEWPRARVTVNLAPAELPKSGGRFDLAIAIGILAAKAGIPATKLECYEFLGELALTGELRTTGGALPAALQAREAGRALILPVSDAREAALARGAIAYPARHINEVTAHIESEKLLEPILDPPAAQIPSDSSCTPDLGEVIGQPRAKRAMEIAAAGRHSALLVGPPGTGKTMLATRFDGLLPEMSEQEAIETASVYSVSAGGFDIATWGRRPFRAPHHTASAVALVGGSSNPKPGEISLAHNGVLFLDELPEFERRVLEVLREPLESGRIIISRAARQAEFPASFQLLCAMNPCPCGHLGDGSDRCECSPETIRRYRSRVSGPLLDRLDLQVETTSTREDITATRKHEQTRSDCSGTPQYTTSAVRERVMTALEVQTQRQGVTNAALQPRGLALHCPLSVENETLMEKAILKLGLSARGRHRTLRVARTIADLANDEDIQTAHLMEAMSYRQLERYAAT